MLLYSYYMQTHKDYNGPSFGLRSLARIYLRGDCYATMRRNIQEKFMGISAASDDTKLRNG